MANTPFPKPSVPKIRPLQPTPKEQAAWQTFEQLIDATGSTPGHIAPIVQTELARLCAQGHPLALRLKERLSIAADRPRQQTEKPKLPPAARRLKHVQWTHGKTETS